MVFSRFIIVDAVRMYSEQTRLIVKQRPFIEYVYYTI